MQTKDLSLVGPSVSLGQVSPKETKAFAREILRIEGKHRKIGGRGSYFGVGGNAKNSRCLIRSYLIDVVRPPHIKAQCCCPGAVVVIKVLVKLELLDFVLGHQARHFYINDHYRWLFMKCVCSKQLLDTAEL